MSITNAIENEAIRGDVDDATEKDPQTVSNPAKPIDQRKLLEQPWSGNDTARWASFMGNISKLIILFWQFDK